MPDRTASARERPEGLGRRLRLRSSALFSEAYGQGNRHVGRFMVLWLRRGDGASLRLGVVSSRKIGGAVARNRARRRLRELFRRDRAALTGSVDVVIVARRGAAEVPFAALSAEWERLTRRAGLRRNSRPDGPGPEMA